MSVTVWVYVNSSRCLTLFKSNCITTSKQRRPFYCFIDPRSGFCVCISNSVLRKKNNTSLSITVDIVCVQRHFHVIINFRFFFFILPDENDEKWFEWGINEKKTVRIKQKPNGSTAWNGIRNRTNENEVDSYNFTFGISHCLNIENYKATINPAIFSVVVVEINALESGSRQRPRWFTTRVVDIWYGAWKHITNSIPKSRC